MGKLLTKQKYLNMHKPTKNIYFKHHKSKDKWLEQPKQIKVINLNIKNLEQLKLQKKLRIKLQKIIKKIKIDKATTKI